MKNVLIYNWTFSRLLWIIIGMVIVAEAIVGKELVTGIAGLIYTGMGVFNKTFCSLGSCSVSQRAAKNDAGIGGIKQIEK